MENSKLKFGPGYKPYEEISRDTIIARGVLSAAGNLGVHGVGRQTMFSGLHLQNPIGELYGTKSLDHHLGEWKLKKGETSNKLVHFKAFGQNGGQFTYNSFQSSGIPSSPHLKVHHLYDQLFTNFLLDAEEQYFKASILSSKIIKGQIKDLHNILPKDGKRLLEIHLQALDDLEKKYNSEISRSILVPNRPKSDLSFSERLDSAFHLFEVAIRLNLVRIANLDFANAGGNYDIPGFEHIKPAKLDDKNAENKKPKRAFHNIAHHGEMEDFHGMLGWHCEKIKNFALALKGQKSSLSNSENLPDILKDSAVLVGQEHGLIRGHDREDVPYFIFGQAGGMLQTNNVVDLGNKQNSLSRLLRTIAYANGYKNWKNIGDSSIFGQGGIIQEIT